MHIRTYQHPSTGEVVRLRGIPARLGDEVLRMADDLDRLGDDATSAQVLELCKLVMRHCALDDEDRPRYDDETIEDEDLDLLLLAGQSVLADSLGVTPDTVGNGPTAGSLSEQFERSLGISAGPIMNGSQTS